MALVQRTTAVLVRTCARLGTGGAIGAGEMADEECHVIARRDGTQERLHLVIYHADGRLVASQSLPFLATPFAWEQMRRYLEHRGWVCTADQHQHPVPSMVFTRHVPGNGETAAPAMCGQRLH